MLKLRDLYTFMENNFDYLLVIDDGEKIVHTSKIITGISLVVDVCNHTMTYLRRNDMYTTAQVTVAIRRGLKNTLLENTTDQIIGMVIDELALMDPIHILTNKDNSHAPISLRKGSKEILLDADEAALVRDTLADVLEGKQ